MRALQKFFSFSELGQVRAIGFERDAIFVELLFDDASFRLGDKEDEVLPSFYGALPAFLAWGSLEQGYIVFVGALSVLDQVFGLGGLKDAEI